MIAETLHYTDGDKAKAAKILGVTSRTIYRKLERRRKELAQRSEGPQESPALADLGAESIDAEPPDSAEEPLDSVRRPGP